MDAVQDRLDRLYRTVSGTEGITILLHDSPDPDAIAAGAALRFLLEAKAGVEGRIVFRGPIGRAENKALVQSLNGTLERLAEGAPLPQGPFALVDTQPGSGNSPLPAGSAPLINIDHHRKRRPNEATFSDIRPWIGATSTILTQYLQAAGLKPDKEVATALFYGIKVDTRSLSREAHQDDVAAYFNLLPIIDVETLSTIENAPVPITYFKKLAAAVNAARVRDGLVVTYMGRLDYPDLTAEVADMLLRPAGVRCAISLGVYQDVLYFSVRASQKNLDAGDLAAFIAGSAGSAGGHESMAAGQIALHGRSPEPFADLLRHRAFEYLDLQSEAEVRLSA